MTGIRLWTHSDQRPRRVVIAGGGVAALEAAITLETLAADSLSVTVISPRYDFCWRAEQVAESFGGVPVKHYELPRLCAKLGVTFIHDALHSVRTQTRDVQLASGLELEYDSLLLAIGASAYPAFTAGICFDRSTEADLEAFAELLGDLDSGLASRVAFVVPRGITWPLPAYELALLAAARSPGIEATVLTPEAAPLEIFGAEASDATARLLAEADVKLICAVHPEVESATVLRAGTHWVEADRIVSLPTLMGPRLHGVACDTHGFTLVDAAQCVPSTDGRVFAVGDGASGSIKQGGIAAQQAAVAAVGILGLAGVAVPRTEAPSPMLRATLNAPGGPLYLSRDFDAPDRTSAASTEPPWQTPGKVVAPRLSRFLATTAATGDYGAVS